MIDLGICMSPVKMRKLYLLETHLKKGCELLMFGSGAKLYYKGTDRWLIGGYSYDGSDVVAAVKEIVDKTTANQKKQLG